MAGRITDKGRERHRRGTGEGADYKPWIQVADFHNAGTGTVFNDWKTGRRVHLLSQGEKYAYLVLRWNDEVTDLREQFPLELEDTIKVAEKLGVAHPRNKNGLARMTTDLVATYTYSDGNTETKAYSVKPDKETLRKSPRSIEHLRIEKGYWGLHGIEYKVLFKEDMNAVFAWNIALAVSYYDIRTVTSPKEAVLYLIAHKKIDADLEHEPIEDSLSGLAAEYFGKGKRWREILSDEQKKMLDKTSAEETSDS